VIIAIFLCALSIRIIYLIQLQHVDPLFYYPIMDALYHHEWAVSIVKGGWLGTDAFFRAPLYPYFLALLYRLFGVNLIIPRIAQAVIGAGSCVLTQRIGMKLFNKKIGTIAGFATALYPLLIYFDIELLIPSVLIFLTLLGFYLIVVYSHKGTNLGWFVTGCVWGLAAITRPNVLFFLLFVPVWVYSKIKKQLATAVPLAALGVLAIILPITIRNYVVSHAFVPIAWQAGTNFYIGNNPHSDGMTAIVPGTRKSWWGGFYDAKRLAEEATGRTLDNAEIDHYWLGQGLSYIKNNPGRAALLFLRKAYLFFHGFEISNNRDIYFFTHLTFLKFLTFTSPVLNIPFGVLLPLALVGCWYAYVRKKDLSLVYLFTITYSLSFILFFVNARYRLPIIPFLIILASYAVVTAYNDVKHRSRRVFVPIGIFVVSLVAFNINFLGIQRVNPALNYLTIAGAQYEQEDYESAIANCEEALHYMPNYAEALVLMGSSYKKLGNRQKALQYYTEALTYDRQQPEAYYNMGNIYAEVGNYNEAEKLFLQAIAVDPYSARAYNNLGNIYFSKDSLYKAREYYDKARTLEPNYTSPLYHLGLVEYRLGHTAQAESLWRKVLAIEPNHRGAQRALQTFIK
jgi:tetratricopeptide (TPR) repeat protein